MTTAEILAGLNLISFSLQNNKLVGAARDLGSLMEHLRAQAEPPPPPAVGQAELEQMAKELDWIIDRLTGRIDTDTSEDGAGLAVMDARDVRRAAYLLGVLRARLPASAASQDGSDDI